MTSLFNLLLVLPLLMPVSAVYADPQDMVNPRLAAVLVEKGVIISLDQLLQKHSVLSNSELLDLELEQEDDLRYIYEIQVLGKDGYITEYEFDAATGVLIQEEFQE